MKRFRPLLITACIFNILLMTSGLATAGFNVSWYMGAAHPQDVDVTATTLALGGATETEKFDTSFELGVRFGYWFTRADWLGLALDGSLLLMEADDADLDLVPVSLLIMFRDPRGQVHPYFGVGPGIFFSDLDTPKDIGDISDKSYDFGIDTRAGLAIDLDPNFSISFEYRFTYFETDLGDRGSVQGVPVDVEVDNDFPIHHLLLGITYNF